MNCCVPGCRRPGNTTLWLGNGEDRIAAPICADHGEMVQAGHLRVPLDEVDTARATRLK